MESYAQKNQLSRSEISETFVKVLSETYMLKKFMLSQLPEMTYKSQQPRLKMMIVDLGCSLTTEMLRMEIAMKQLKVTYLLNDSVVAEGLNVKTYLLHDITSVSLYNDAKLLHHLMLILGIEANSFRLLTVLSKQLYPRSVHKLMKMNLEDATRSERKLLTTYNTYLKI
ncbi:MAG: hypothetical protein EOP46_01645 [Sphingobacteriaceae bacterium]|nr:MAG: hypothetical protein EOP46_01645 [Sphingobacteriaceae bacterium]